MTGLNPNQWLTTSEAAELTGYNKSYLRRLLRKGHIEGVKRGRDWLLSRQSVLEHKRRMDALGTQKHSPKQHDEAGD